MHHSKSLKLWQLPNDFHRELSKGARLLYSRLMALTNAGAQDCFYSNQLGMKEFGVTERTIERCMKELKDACLIEATRSRNKRVVTVVSELAPRPAVVKTSKLPTQKQEQAAPHATSPLNVPARFEVRAWHKGETYEVTAEMVEQIYAKPPKLRRVVLRADRCGGLSTDALNLYSHLLDLCDREPCRCLYSEEQGFREFGFTPDQLSRNLKDLSACRLIYFFPIEEPFLKGQVVYFVSITVTKALLNILRSHTWVDVAN